MFFETRRQRPIITLNVVALIDISALLIIFLIMGSFFGESSIQLPANMVIPKSVSKESIENAPSVMLSPNEVSTNFGVETVPLDVFRKDDQRLQDYKSKLKKFVDGIPPEARQSGVLINFMADKSAPYRDVFDVIRHYREAGFQSILFVAQGK